MTCESVAVRMRALRPIVAFSGDDVVFRTSVPYIDWPRLD